MPPRVLPRQLGYVQQAITAVEEQLHPDLTLIQAMSTLARLVLLAVVQMTYVQQGIIVLKALHHPYHVLQEPTVTLVSSIRRLSAYLVPQSTIVPMRRPLIPLIVPALLASIVLVVHQVPRLCVH